jgi:hypothetical protein
MAHSIDFEPPPVGNAITDLSDVQLWNAQVIALLGCGRARSGITRKREEYVCFLNRVLKVEALRRGQTPPPADANTSDLRKA